MGNMIPVATNGEYAAAVRLLFPRGEFWDAQFEGDTDLVAYCAAKAEELARFKVRSSDLFDESVPDTTTELVDDWERVVGISNRGYPLSTRRDEIKNRGLGNVSWQIVQGIVERFGGTLDDFSLPYFPAQFGHTRFGSRFSLPAAFNIVELRISLDVAYRPDMEESVAQTLLGYHLIHFLYRTETDEYVP